MKRTTYLKIMGLGWCIPFILAALPTALLSVLFDCLETVAEWVARKVEKMNDVVQSFLAPPKWWPSQKYLNELNEIREIRQKEAIDRLHSGVAKEKP